jgi:transcriptional regulator GlxA family with amidase domain
LLVGYKDADGLDLFGPAEVFAEAVRRLGAVYEIVMSAVGGGAMTLTSGISVAAADLTSLRPQASDIVIVAGGEDEATEAAAKDRALLGWLARASRTVSRMASVCDGAFVLASAGILDGKRAATHWYSCERLARLHPKVHVDREAIFVRDGRVWTAAGVSTGIDTGFQSQFSEELVAQTLAGDPLGPQSHPYGFSMETWAEN